MYRIATTVYGSDGAIYRTTDDALFALHDDGSRVWFDTTEDAADYFDAVIVRTISIPVTSSDVLDGDL